MLHSTLEDMTRHRKQLAYLLADPLIGHWLDADALARFVHDETAELGPYAACVVEQEARWLDLVYTAGAVVSIRPV